MRRVFSSSVVLNISGHLSLIDLRPLYCLGLDGRQVGAGSSCKTGNSIGKNDNLSLVSPGRSLRLSTALPTSSFRMKCDWKKLYYTSHNDQVALSRAELRPFKTAQSGWMKYV